MTLSNDSWFDEGPGLRLHLVVSAFRSIETCRPQLRATNTGISAFIPATGELLATAPAHERTTLVATVAPVRDATTLVLAWGIGFARRPWRLPPCSWGCSRGHPEVAQGRTGGVRRPEGRWTPGP